MFRSPSSRILPIATHTTRGIVRAIQAVTHEWINYIDDTGIPHLTQPAFGDISGTAASAQLGSGTANSTTFLRGDSTWTAPNNQSTTGPTVTVLTSGSGTYTVPTGAKWLRVRMIGGGGGGGGSGSSSGTAGGNGGDTTFGTSFLTAGHGVGAPNSGGGGNGGTASGGDVNITGAQGGDNIGSASLFGGTGAATPFGGGGSGGYGVGTSGPGNAAPANSGAGGGGGGIISSGNTNGGGGGAGGYLEKIITSPSASYAYAVGAAGTAGALSGVGANGAAGGSGLIIIEEHYNN